MALDHVGDVLAQDAAPGAAEDVADEEYVHVFDSKSKAADCQSSTLLWRRVPQKLLIDNMERLPVYQQYFIVIGIKLYGVLVQLIVKSRFTMWVPNPDILMLRMDT